MITDILRSGLNAFRGARSRFAYESRINDVPSFEIANRTNVLIVTIDCLRYDRVSRTGYDRTTTPFIDSFESMTPAIAPAPWTFSSVPSILTGLYPHNHGAIYPDDSSRNQDLRNPPNGVHGDVYTLPEILAANGYETRFTTAIGTAAIPTHGRFKTTKRRHDADAATLLSEIQDWWNSTNKSKFGYVQLGDLHEPLHEPGSIYFGEIPDVEGIDRWRFKHGETDAAEFDDYRFARELLFDTLLRNVDNELERMVEELDEIGETIVIVTSDHGEEFWEYQEFEQEHFDDPRGISGVGHGHALVPPVLEVPIVTNLDNIEGLANKMSLVDIVPTVFRELGASGELSFDGVPLQVADRDGPVLSQEIAYGPNQISATDNRDHLIYVPQMDASFLFDFETGEEIVDENLEEYLLSYIPVEKKQGSAVELTSEVKDQLSDLGYAEE